MVYSAATGKPCKAKVSTTNVLTLESSFFYTCFSCTVHLVELLIRGGRRGIVLSNVMFRLTNGVTGR
jgi:hypothetical protein